MRVNGLLRCRPVCSSLGCRHLTQRGSKSTNLATAKSQWPGQAGPILPRPQGMERLGDWPRMGDGAGTYQGHSGAAAWPCLGQPGRSLWAAGELPTSFPVSLRAPPSSCTALAQLLPRSLLPSSRLIIGKYHKTSTKPHHSEADAHEWGGHRRSTGWIISGN